MKTQLRAFGMFWYDFIIGDDWTVAAGVVLALLITGVVASFAVPAWWIVPAAITILLSLSLWRATRPAGAGRQPGFRCRQGLSASTRTSG